MPGFSSTIGMGGISIARGMKQHRSTIVQVDDFCQAG